MPPDIRCRSPPMYYTVQCGSQHIAQCPEYVGRASGCNAADRGKRFRAAVKLLSVQGLSVGFQARRMIDVAGTGATGGRRPASSQGYLRG